MGRVGRWFQDHLTSWPASSPLLDRRGGRDIKRNIAKLPLKERTGWWFKIDRLETEPPPRLRHQRRLRSFFLMAQPPLLSRRGNRGLPGLLRYLALVAMGAIAVAAPVSQGVPAQGAFNRIVY